MRLLERLDARLETVKPASNSLKSLQPVRNRLEQLELASPIPLLRVREPRFALLFARIFARFDLLGRNALSQGCSLVLGLFLRLDVADYEQEGDDNDAKTPCALMLPMRWIAEQARLTHCPQEDGPRHAVVRDGGGVLGGHCRIAQMCSLNGKECSGQVFGWLNSDRLDALVIRVPFRHESTVGDGTPLLICTLPCIVDSCEAREGEIEVVEGQLGKTTHRRHVW